MIELEKKINCIIDCLNSQEISINVVYDFYNILLTFQRVLDDYASRITGADEKNRFYRNLHNRLNRELERRHVELNSVCKTTVFLSHAHKDLGYAYCVARFLKENYGVNVYIDAFDSSMPSITSVDTARKLRNKIIRSQRFIFIGTKESFESKWCNWELGLSDAKCSKGHLAFFIMSDRNEKNGGFHKNEYVGLYPFIWDADFRGIDATDDILYVGHYNWDNKTFVSLKEWLSEEKVFFQHSYKPHTTEINNQKNIAAFYLSKFQNDALDSLNCDTLTKALSKLSLGISGKDNGYLLRRYYEFKDYLERNENAFNDNSVLRRVKYYYNVLNGMPFDVFKHEILKMIDK